MTIETILHHLTAAGPDGLTLRQLHRKGSTSGATLRRQLDALVSRKMVACEVTQGPTGRPRTTYRRVHDGQT